MDKIDKRINRILSSILREARVTDRIPIKPVEDGEDSDKEFNGYYKKVSLIGNKVYKKFYRKSISSSRWKRSIKVLGIIKSNPDRFNFIAPLELLSDKNLIIQKRVILPPESLVRESENLIIDLYQNYLHEKVSGINIPDINYFLDGDRLLSLLNGDRVKKDYDPIVIKFVRSFLRLCSQLKKNWSILKYLSDYYLDNKSLKSIPDLHLENFGFYQMKPVLFDW